ncbi:MAG: DUF1289 domain-containing protein [Rubrivivax sp.]|nr:MAG: DUF1289 domain-containing protein [Rubrivivax sp.]
MTPVVASPCIDVCEMDAATGWCRGCARSLQEIAGWGGAPATVQRQILDQLPARRVQLHRHGVWLGAMPANMEPQR